MTNITLASVLTAVALLSSQAVLADEQQKSNTNIQNISKLPYEQTVNHTASNPDAQWEGATLINQETAAEKNNKTLRLHMLGKRPFAEKATN